MRQGECQDLHKDDRSDNFWEMEWIVVGSKIRRSTECKESRREDREQWKKELAERYRKRSGAWDTMTALDRVLERHPVSKRSSSLAENYLKGG